MKINNFCVIMGGGVGSRFWPFSKEDKPKQFLDFFGTGRSLLQSTFDRFKKIIPVENIFVVTNDAYAEMTLKQLPELSKNQILLEPLRRNTAPAIAYAVSHSSNKRMPTSEVPSDHLILKKMFSCRPSGAPVCKKNRFADIRIKQVARKRDTVTFKKIEGGVDGIKKVKPLPKTHLNWLKLSDGEFVGIRDISVERKRY